MGSARSLEPVGTTLCDFLYKNRYAQNHLSMSLEKKPNHKKNQGVPHRSVGPTESRVTGSSKFHRIPMDQKQLRLTSHDFSIFSVPFITYGPRKAVAEVSNHNEPIGRKSGIQLVRKSMDFTFNCFVLN